MTKNEKKILLFNSERFPYSNVEMIFMKDPEVLAEVLRRGKNDVFSLNAANNPRCPSEALEKVLRRGKNDNVSYWAVRNPNCPPKAILEFYEATGQLTKYDPEIHELEKVPEDKDLEELKKLL